MLHAPFDVVAEAARGQHDASADLDVRALLAGHGASAEPGALRDLRADDAPVVILDELGEHEVALGLKSFRLGLFPKGADDGRAGSLGLEGAAGGVAAVGEHLGLAVSALHPLHADAVQPFEDVVGALCDETALRHVVQIESRDEHVVHVIVDRVLDAVFRLGGRVADAEIAVAFDGVAADAAALVDEHHLGAGVVGVKGGRVAGEPGAHDEDVGFGVPGRGHASCCGRAGGEAGNAERAGAEQRASLEKVPARQFLRCDHWGTPSDSV